MTFYDKYLKYKNKYIDLKNLVGGSNGYNTFYDIPVKKQNKLKSTYDDLKSTKKKIRVFLDEKVKKINDGTNPDITLDYFLENFDLEEDSEYIELKKKYIERVNNFVISALDILYDSLEISIRIYKDRKIKAMSDIVLTEPGNDTNSSIVINKARDVKDLIEGFLKIQESIIKIYYFISLYINNIEASLNYEFLNQNLKVDNTSVKKMYDIIDSYKKNFYDICMTIDSRYIHGIYEHIIGLYKENPYDFNNLQIEINDFVNRYINTEFDNYNRPFQMLGQKYVHEIYDERNLPKRKLESSISIKSKSLSNIMRKFINDNLTKYLVDVDITITPFTDIVNIKNKIIDMITIKETPEIATNEEVVSSSIKESIAISTTKPSTSSATKPSTSSATKPSTSSTPKLSTTIATKESIATSTTSAPKPSAITTLKESATSAPKPSAISILKESTTSAPKPSATKESLALFTTESRSPPILSVSSSAAGGELEIDNLEFIKASIKDRHVANIIKYDDFINKIDNIKTDIQNELIKIYKDIQVNHRINVVPNNNYAIIEFMDKTRPTGNKPPLSQYEEIIHLTIHKFNDKLNVINGLIHLNLLDEYIILSHNGHSNKLYFKNKLKYNNNQIVKTIIELLETVLNKYFDASNKLK